jgi:hypothetical protein
MRDIAPGATDAAFKKQQRLEQAAEGWKAYTTEQAAIEANRQRLRAARLAREGAEAAALTPPTKPVARGKAKSNRA